MSKINYTKRGFMSYDEILEDSFSADKFVFGTKPGEGMYQRVKEYAERASADLVSIDTSMHDSRINLTDAIGSTSSDRVVVCAQFHGVPSLIDYDLIKQIYAEINENVSGRQVAVFMLMYGVPQMMGG